MSSPPVTPKMENDYDLSPSPQKRSPDDDHPDASPTKKPKTPRKKAAATDKTPKTPKTPKGARTPKANNGALRTTSNAIPASWDDASQADRMIFKMKQDGKTAKEIKTAYESMTGKTVGDSTLSVRISRLKANFARLDDGDDIKMLAAVEKFEEEKAKFERAKFSRVAAIMLEGGTQAYSSMLIEKELKRISDAKAAGTWVPSRPVDEDEDEAVDAVENIDGDDVDVKEEYDEGIDGEGDEA